MEETEVNDAIRAVKQGRTREFARLLQEFGLQIRSFVHSRVQNRADAEDIAQQTFIAAFRGLDKFEIGQSFEAWLIGIAKNRVLMHFRGNDRRHTALDKFREECLVRIKSELEDSAEEYRSRRISALSDCIEQLPERMRRVIRGRLREETGDAIADKIGISRGAIYMIQMRANGKLKECLEGRTA